MQTLDKALAAESPGERRRALYVQRRLLIEQNADHWQCCQFHERREHLKPGVLVKDPAALFLLRELEVDELEWRLRRRSSPALQRRLVNAYVRLTESLNAMSEGFAKAREAESNRLQALIDSKQALIEDLKRQCAERGIVVKGVSP